MTPDSPTANAALNILRSWQRDHLHSQFSTIEAQATHRRVMDEIAAGIRLLESAPDLLAALERIRDAPRDYTSPEVFDRLARDTARAAIARARGVSVA